MVRRARSFRAPARTKMWVGIDLSPQQVDGSASTLLGVYSASVLLQRPFTILRTRGEILYSSDQVVASETPFGKFGIGVFTDTATGSMVRLPNPGDNPEQDWFVYQSVIADFNFATAAGFESDFGHHYEIDSKAMRKVGPDDDIAVIQDQQSTTGALISFLGRQLIQLH